MATHDSCGRCPVSLTCLAGRLKVICYCAKCRCLQVQGSLPYSYLFIECSQDKANDMHVQLSICDHCRFMDKQGRLADIEESVRKRKAWRGNDMS